MATEFIGRAPVPRLRGEPDVPTRSVTWLPVLTATAVRAVNDVETAIEVAVQRSRVSMKIMEAVGEAEVEQYLRDIGFRG
ncbi:hypothetical protein [Actinoplanes philippinensis]|uniref:hypothetical protein n=1 Tax=Actinoplanes philippinensis TaxID=35752 RepID=UPI0033EE9FF7